MSTVSIVYLTKWDQCNPLIFSFAIHKQSRGPTCTCISPFAKRAFKCAELCTSSLSKKKKKKKKKRGTPTVCRLLPDPSPAATTPLPPPQHHQYQPPPPPHSKITMAVQSLFASFCPSSNQTLQQQKKKKKKKKLDNSHFYSTSLYVCHRDLYLLGNRATLSDRWRLTIGGRGGWLWREWGRRDGRVWRHGACRRRRKNGCRRTGAEAWEKEKSVSVRWCCRLLGKQRAAVHALCGDVWRAPRWTEHAVCFSATRQLWTALTESAGPRRTQWWTAHTQKRDQEDGLVSIPWQRALLSSIGMPLSAWFIITSMSSR